MTRNQAALAGALAFALALIAALMFVSPLVSAFRDDFASPQATSTGLVDRFLAREDPPPSSYRALRRLSARNSRFKLDGWIEVETTLTAGRLEWRVLDEGGSGMIRNRVLRKALAGEAELLAKGEGARGAFTPANYDFEIVGNGRVDLRPKRTDTLLITGFVLLAETDADLLEVNGQLTKNPSFWTRNVRVQRRYARLNGVRVPIATTSVADVRFAGQSHFEMTYRYLAVNGEAVPASTGTVGCTGIPFAAGL
jgi:hypothetical protein